MADSPEIVELRRACADLHEKQSAILRAAALALWHGATVAQVRRACGHWPELPDPLPDSAPVWHHLP